MKNTIYTLALGMLLGACDGFLDGKPSKDIDTPGTLQSLQAMLDYGGMNFSPGLSNILTDEYFSDDAGYLSLPPWHQNLYLWKESPFELEDMILDFRQSYNQIQTADIVLETLEENQDKDSEFGRNIRGTALFYRAMAYYELSNLFLEGPNLAGAGLESVIPIRKSTSITLDPEVGNLEEVKAMIRRDLEFADGLLPVETTYLIQPTRAAAKALKARVYLNWGEYVLAREEAEEVLGLDYELLDYGEISTDLNYSFEEFNQEVIWHGRFNGSFNFSQSGYQVDQGLLDLYGEGDLRRDLFYITRPNGYVNFKGSYSGGINLFSGLAIDEMYLILSECLVRNGEFQRAVQVLNELLVKRYGPGFTPVAFSEETEALSYLFQERRKELPFRGLRWTDLRRLNADDRFKETLTRKNEGQLYSLLPDSRQYVLPLPPRELSFY